MGTVEGRGVRGVERRRAQSSCGCLCVHTRSCVRACSQARTRVRRRARVLMCWHAHAQATGEGKGAAFVKYEDYECAVAAIKALHNNTTMAGLSDVL